MKRSFVLVIFVLVQYLGKSQTVVYGEYFVSKMLIANLDCKLKKNVNGFGLRLGLGFSKVEKDTIIVLPLGINYIHKLDDGLFGEVGLNYYLIAARPSLSFNNNEFKDNFFSLAFAFVFKPEKDEGIFFRVSANPVFSKLNIAKTYIGVGVGYSF